MKWLYTVNIKQFLSDEEDAAAIQRAYDGIKSELLKLPMPYPCVFDRYAKLAIKEEDAEIFNLGLSRLYDWADAERIWLG